MMTPPPKGPGLTSALKQAGTVFRSMARGLGLVFRASGFSAYVQFFLTATAGLVPVGVAWMTKLVVDTIGAAASDGRIALPFGLASGPGGEEATRVVIILIAALLAIWIVDRAIVGIGGLVDTNVRLSTEHYIHTLLMRTAGRLDLAFYENPEYRNMLERATHGAIQSSYLVVSVVFHFIRTALQFISFALVLTSLHWLATVLIVVVTAPQMVAAGYHARREFAMHFDMAEDSRLRHYVAALMSERDPAKDFVRYALTARENVGFGDIARVEDTRATEAAARKSGIHDTLSALDEGYETYLGKQFGVGTDLSGGEWQRVGLSRAYMRDSGVLILDEPTASLDAFAEFEVFKAFSELMSDRISVVISHRFSNVRLAEHIIVLDEGRMVGEGSHEELMAAGGLYAEMFDTQAEGYR